MRYLCHVAYRGNNYVGFQSQINGLAIQDVIQEQLEVIFKEKIKIIMASRTDSKVHALDQVFHFDAQKDIDPYRLKGSLNALLPKDIHINKAEVTASDFHCRYNCKGKYYRYIINTGEYSPFLDGFAYQCFYDLDLEKMIAVAKLFVGRHDFSSFNTTPLEVKSDQVRTIFNLDIEKRDDLLLIDIKGDGFLRHMVRMIVGTLIDVGRGQKTIQEVQKMLAEPSKDTKRYNIDACGLYLMKIYY